MLKNRDAASNPYRVPPQPTSGWVKISIVSLFLIVLALMGSVVFLVIQQQQCSCATPITPELGKGKQTKEKTADNSLPQDQAPRQDVEVEKLFRRFENLYTEVQDINNHVTQLDDVYRSRDQDQPTGSSTSQSLSPSEIALLQKVPKIDSRVRGIETKLQEHMGAEQRVCPPGHFRYGVYCYVIGEASMTQSEAQKWCTDDYGSQASLAIVKDKSSHDFIASKLTNRIRSFWIGIQRQRGPSSLISEAPGSQLAPSSVRSGQFEYLDGTRVQRNVWQMWRPRTSIEMDEAASNRRENKDCASLSFDQYTNQWRWAERSCSDGAGFVCQYFILTS